MFHLLDEANSTNHAGLTRDSRNVKYQMQMSLFSCVALMGKGLKAREVGLTCPVSHSTAFLSGPVASHIHAFLFSLSCSWGSLYLKILMVHLPDSSSGAKALIIPFHR